MDNERKVQLKEIYEKMPDEELHEMLLVDKDEYDEGVYELVASESKKRGLTPTDLSKTTDISDGGGNEGFVMASTGKRFLNYLIDVFVSWGVTFILVLFLVLFGVVDSNSLDRDEFYKGIGLLACILYYIIFELRFQKTVGKFITKTEVLSKDGSKPTVGQIFGRTLSRFVPFDVISGFFGKSDVWHGWHDRWSNTIVVDSKYSKNNKKSSTKANVPAKRETKTIKRKIKKCPYCAEKILAEAIKCQYCKEFLDNKS